jgi:hypothetical protein
VYGWWLSLGSERQPQDIEEERDEVRIGTVTRTLQMAAGPHSSQE